MSWFRTQNRFSSLTGREQFRRIAYKLLAAQAFVEITEDGQLSKEDLEPAARGLASAALIWLEEPILQYLKKRGLFVGANVVGNWLTAFYLTGLTASYVIDEEEGIANYNDFVFDAITPWESNNMEVTQMRVAFSIAIIFFNDWKSQGQIDAEKRIEESNMEPSIFVESPDFGIFDSFIRALS